MVILFSISRSAFRLFPSQKKGAPFSGRPWICLSPAEFQSATSSAALFNRLGQVVTERREQHVVEPVRVRGRARRCAGARPRVAVHVGILRSKLNPTLRTLVEPIPEADRAFENYSGVSVAVRQCSRNKPVGSEDRRG